MTAEAAALDISECSCFLQFWMETTDTNYVTLVVIVSEGKTSTRSFERSDLDGAKAWIVRTAIESRSEWHVFHALLEPEERIRERLSSRVQGLIHTTSWDADDDKGRGRE